MYPLSSPSGTMSSILDVWQTIMAKDHSININATELAVIAAALFFSFHLFFLIYFSVYFLKLSMEPPLLD